MSTFLEVREFDKIHCNEEFKEQHNFLSEDDFHELEDFMYDFDDENSADATALDFLKHCTIKGIGRAVSVNNYVGLIQTPKGNKIQILPKIELGDDKDDTKENGYPLTKRVFLKMLSSMNDFPCKVFSDANIQVGKMNLYEIFINMYLAQVRILVKRGLKSSYLGIDNNLFFYKGRLNVNEQIKYNAAHKERFCVHYDEFMVDRAENRIIKATLLLLQRLTLSSKNQKEIRQLLPSFELVTPSTNHHKEFSKVVSDRNTRDYTDLMAWSKVFLFNKGFTTFRGDTKSRAILFKMDKVFESYVAKRLAPLVYERGWSIKTQDRGLYLFDTPKRFALRPDIVITQEDQNRRIILDTKWKELTDKPSDNYGIIQADMYQMYAYSKKYQTSEVCLLYPKTKDMNNDKNILYKGNDNVNVRVFFVDVCRIEDSLNHLLSIYSLKQEESMHIHSLTHPVAAIG